MKLLESCKNNEKSYQKFQNVRLHLEITLSKTIYYFNIAN